MSHNLSWKNLRCFFLMFALCVLMLLHVPSFAQSAHDEAGHGPNTAGSVATEMTESAEQNTGKDVGPHGGAMDSHADGHGEEKHGSEHHDEASHGEGHHEAPGTFDPHAGTLVNPIARALFNEEKVTVTSVNGEKHFTGIKYDFIVIALLIMLLLATAGVLGARRMRLRPEGSPVSLSHIVETAAEGFRNYLIGVMGPKLAAKYAPLISSYFFTILFFNYMGLVPGMIAPTSNPNIPVALALVAFVCVHVIAIKEAGFKSWFMHLVGQPLWLAPLNFPLHLMGELIKPLSLSIRLLCNVFGEEMVILQLSLLAVGIYAATNFPIPLQFPILCLGLLFGMLQALVFSTLLAIYISILADHHDDHDHGHETASGHGHETASGHVEKTRVHGHSEVIAHPTESPVA